MSCRSQQETWPSLTSLSGDLDTWQAEFTLELLGQCLGVPPPFQTGLPEPTLALERKAGLAFQWSQVISLTSFMYSVFCYFLCVWCLRSMLVNLPWMVSASQKALHSGIAVLKWISARNDRPGGEKSTNTSVMKSPMSQNHLILYRVLETNHPTSREGVFFQYFQLNEISSRKPSMYGIFPICKTSQKLHGETHGVRPPSGHAAGWCPAAASRRGRGSSELADGDRGGRGAGSQRVDGWNPVKSPVEVKVVYHSMMIIPLFTGFGIHPSWLGMVFLRSTIALWNHRSGWEDDPKRSFPLSHFPLIMDEWEEG